MPQLLQLLSSMIVLGESILCPHLCSIVSISRWYMIYLVSLMSAMANLLSDGNTYSKFMVPKCGLSECWTCLRRGCEIFAVVDGGWCCEGNPYRNKRGYLYSIAKVLLKLIIDLAQATFRLCRRRLESCTTVDSSWCRTLRYVPKVADQWLKVEIECTRRNVMKFQVFSSEGIGKYGPAASLV